MRIFEALWWLSFWAALGLCLGSFLNAVIYRLPRNRSIRNPLWSFCPNCGHRIHWYDNLPILSFVLLRGRCRNCSVPIATRYLVIEALMAVIVLMLLDAFFIGGVRAGLATSRFGLTDELDSDWPILLAHVILFACLFPMSVIDLEHYWVDVRFTNFATAAGFVLHAVWTPRHSMDWIRPWDSTAIASILATAALVVVWVVRVCQPRVAPEHLGEELEPSTLPLPTEPNPARQPPPSLASPSRLAGWIAGVLLLFLFIVLALDESGRAELRHPGRALLPLLCFFALIVWESTLERPADQLIVDAIHEERFAARRTALRELAILIPVGAAAALGWWLMSRGGGLADRLHEALHVQVLIGSWTLKPVLGLATAASGYIISGAIGWTVRIVFTLVFGKEAFGTGDIHLMAATGCVAGWPVVVLAFFLTCGLAMFGWLLTLPFKWTRALPLGPWLSLSFLAVVVFYDAIVRWPVIERAVYTVNLLIFGNSQVFPIRNGH